MTAQLRHSVTCTHSLSTKFKSSEPHDITHEQNRRSLRSMKSFNIIPFDSAHSFSPVFSSTREPTDAVPQMEKPLPPDPIGPEPPKPVLGPYRFTENGIQVALLFPRRPKPIPALTVDSTEPQQGARWVNKKPLGDIFGPTPVDLPKTPLQHLKERYGARPSCFQQMETGDFDAYRPPRASWARKREEDTDESEMGDDAGETENRQ